jgi:predicted acetyltransferase
MNKQLIEDEGSDNPMDLAELETRMSGFLRGDFRAFFFKASNKILGYALVRTSPDPMYLRQFFICRDHRRRGYGKAAFHALLAHLDIDSIDLDVLLGNRPGRSFWRSLGFEKRSVSMRLTNAARCAPLCARQ